MFNVIYSGVTFKQSSTHQSLHWCSFSFSSNWENRLFRDGSRSQVGLGSGVGLGLGVGLNLGLGLGLGLGLVVLVLGLCLGLGVTGRVYHKRLGFGPGLGVWVYLRL